MQDHSFALFSANVVDKDEDDARMCEYKKEEEKKRLENENTLFVQP